MRAPPPDNNHLPQRAQAHLTSLTGAVISADAYRTQIEALMPRLFCTCQGPDDLVSLGFGNVFLKCSGGSAAGVALHGSLCS